MSLKPNMFKFFVAIFFSTLSIQSVYASDANDRPPPPISSEDPDGFYSDSFKEWLANLLNLNFVSDPAQAKPPRPSNAQNWPEQSKEPEEEQSRLEEQKESSEKESDSGDEKRDEKGDEKGDETADGDDKNGDAGDKPDAAF